MLLVSPPIEDQLPGDRSIVWVFEYPDASSVSVPPES